MRIMGAYKGSGRILSLVKRPPEGHHSALIVPVRDKAYKGIWATGRPGRIPHRGIIEIFPKYPFLGPIFLDRHRKIHINELVKKCTKWSLSRVCVSFERVWVKMLVIKGG
ncbi:MAG: hypothetical protein JRH06_02175 [Deltaproteobacteria bacterium]|nr:hypothetical protein [Deltaproteobacteria bacterium]MBW2136345.1 hypothetical protein [Deltaproteobacteria bacterium]